MSRKAKDFQELNKLITKPKKVWKPNTTNKEIPTPAKQPVKEVGTETPRLSRPSKPHQRKKLTTPKVAIKDYPV